MESVLTKPNIVLGAGIRQSSDRVTDDTLAVVTRAEGSRDERRPGDVGGSVA